MVKRRSYIKELKNAIKSYFNAPGSMWIKQILQNKSTTDLFRQLFISFFQWNFFSRSKMNEKKNPEIVSKLIL
jgi:hypothetical protein